MRYLQSAGQQTDTLHMPNYVISIF